MGKLYCNVDTILVDNATGDGKIRFNRGDEVKGVPAGSLDSMIRLRQVTDVEPVDEVEAPIVAERAVALVVDWQATSINASELPRSIKKALAAEGLSTAGEVMAYGEQNGSLTVINGIAEAGESAIQSWLLGLMPPASVADEPIKE